MTKVLQRVLLSKLTNVQSEIVLETKSLTFPNTTLRLRSGMRYYACLTQTLYHRGTLADASQKLVF